MEYFKIILEFIIMGIQSSEATPYLKAYQVSFFLDDATVDTGRSLIDIAALQLSRPSIIVAKLL
jgi:hypothetical protein